MDNNIKQDKEVTKRGYPQLSVAIDLFGDVFLYREAGFLNRDGNKDYRYLKKILILLK